MDIIALSAIALASAVNSAMPGPCVAMTIARSARDGIPAGASVSLGVVSANLVLCVAALSIIHGILAFSPSAYAAMKWIGIAALLFLAHRMLRGPTRANEGRNQSGKTNCGDLSAGLAVGLSSPFNLVFLLALLPQLVPTDDQSATGFVLITLAVLSGAALSLAGAVLIGAASSRVLGGAGCQIERVGALSMIGFACLASTTPIV